MNGMTRAGWIVLVVAVLLLILIAVAEEILA